MSLNVRIGMYRRRLFMSACGQSSNQIRGCHAGGRPPRLGPDMSRPCGLPSSPVQSARWYVIGRNTDVGSARVSVSGCNSVHVYTIL